MERESETLRTPPSLNAICRGGSPLPSPPAPGAYAPLAGAGCGALWGPWAFCAPATAAAAWAAILPICSGMVGYGVIGYGVVCGGVVVVVVVVGVVVLWL